MYSYQALEELLGFSKSLPVTENWSAAADFLKVISEYCLERKPKTIVECSSGTSSLVLSQCCQINMYGHVYSLENAEEYASQTRSHLAEHLLEEYNTVIHSPLKEYRINGECYQWYDLQQMPKLEIDMLVVDGPPGFIQDKSRYLAIPLLHNSLAKKCVVLLDDADREDEKEIIDLWLEEYPEFHLEYMKNERGCAILTR